MDRSGNYMINILGEKTLVVIKNGHTIFTSEKKRLKPVIDCIRALGEGMKGAEVYDRVTGLAAARLLAFVRVSEIHTLTASRNAQKYLSGTDLVFTADEFVDEILNDSRTDTCPMEKLAKISSDMELYEKLVNAPDRRSEGASTAS